MNKYRIDAIENNFFIEGLQGAGKSTFVQKLSAELTDYKVFCEGGLFACRAGLVRLCNRRAIS